MTQPKDLPAQLSALDGKVTQLQASVSERLAGIEQLLAGAQPRLAVLEEAARGFESRVLELEAKAHEPSNADAARLEKLEKDVATYLGAVDRLSQAVRPARSAMREQLSSVEAALAEIKDRLPPASNR